MTTENVFMLAFDVTFALVYVGIVRSWIKNGVVRFRSLVGADRATQPIAFWTTIGFFGIAVATPIAGQLGTIFGLIKP